MFTLEDVKSTLTKLENGQALYEVVSNAVLQERTKGKGLVQAVQTKMDAMGAALKSLGFDSATNDVESFVTEIKGKVEAGTKAKGKLSASEQRMVDLEKSVSQLNKQLGDSQAEATKFKANHQNATIKDALMPRLAKKIYSAEIHAKDMIREGLVVLNEDGKTVSWKGSDGNATDLDTGLNGYFDSHKDSLINDQKGGGGGSGNSGDQGGGKSVNRSAFNDMSPQARVAHMKDGGSVTD